MITPRQTNIKADTKRLLTRKDGILRDYHRGVKLDVILKRYRIKNVKFIYKYILDDGTRRLHPVPPDVREAILSSEKQIGVRVLAAKFGISKTTVHRIRTSGFDHWADDDESQIDDEETVAFVPHTWRCPDHGKVTMSPCPICAARGVTQRPAEFMPASRIERNFETILVTQ
jgi:hypothetical protein